MLKPGDNYYAFVVAVAKHARELAQEAEDQSGTRPPFSPAQHAQRYIQNLCQRCPPLAEEGALLEAVRDALTPKDLAGLSVLVTAGPTRGPLRLLPGGSPPLPRISQPSAGRMRGRSPHRTSPAPYGPGQM